MDETEPSPDRLWMRRALELAVRGRGAVEPNPMVGCVIVKDGRVIGEGFHERFGGPHAEPNALAACSESPAGATAYVTLEPCCHTGKKTPPCVPKVIDAKLGRVVIGATDPNPSVNGGGIEQLRRAGIDVTAGVLEAGCRQLIAPFFALVKLGRPYVTLKWAQTSDGKMAGPPGRRMWISNRQSTRVVHELRARCDAILVGRNTVLCDDPLLTARGIACPRPLLRVVLTSQLQIPIASRLVQTARESPVLVLCASQAREREQATVAELEAHGVEVAGLASADASHLDLRDVVDTLGKRSVTHLLVEPGPTLAREWMSLPELVDRVWVFRSPTPAEDPLATAAPDVAYPATGEGDIAGDRLTEYLNPDGSAFFSLQPSADFLLVTNQ